MTIPSQKHPFLLIWVTLTLLCYLKSIKCYQIYIDANSTAETHLGTEDSPFLNIEEALNMLEEIQQQSKTSLDISIYLKARDVKYSANLSTLTFTNDNISSFSISAWDDPGTIDSFSDCSALPTMDFTNISLSFITVPVIEISSINIIYSGSSVLVRGSNTNDNADSLTMRNLCLNGHGQDYDYFLRAQNIPNLVIENMRATLSYGKTIISYINGFNEVKPITAVFNDIHLHLLSAQNGVNDLNSTNTIFQFISHTEFSFTEPDDANVQNFTMTGITINTQEKGQIVPTIARFTGWDNIIIDQLTFENQECSFINSGVFVISECGDLNLTNISMTGNNIRTDGSDVSANGATFLMINDINNMIVLDTHFSENAVSFQYGSGAPFTLMSLKNIQKFVLSKYNVSSNQFAAPINVINFDTQFVSMESLQFALYDLYINNNSILSQYNFYFFKFQLSEIESFSMENLEFKNNNLTGRLFYFEAVANISNIDVDPTFINMTNLVIDSNPILTNFALIFLSATNPYTVASDFAYPSEFYSIALTNMSISNNLFTKTTNADFLDTSSLIQVAGSQVYVENCLITNNEFINSDFIALERQVSSVFFIRSNAINNNFTNGSLINTQYELLTITRGSYKDRSRNSIKLMYRFAFVHDSNFLRHHHPRKSIVYLKQRIPHILIK